MIDIGKILKRAWHILWNYRVLWIFGILLAFASGGRSGGSNGGGSAGPSFNGGNNPGTYPTPAWLQNVNTWAQQNLEPLFTHPEKHITTYIWIGIGILAFILVVAVIMAVIRYVSETAMMRMVNEYEQAGTKVGFKQGLKMGWSRAAFRMWLIDFIIGLPALVFLVILLGLGVAVYFSVTNGSHASAVASVVAAIGCTFLFIFVFIILMIALGLVRPFFARVTALENAGVGESFRRGWEIFRNNWKSAVLMWLVMLGLGIGFALIFIFMLILLVPVFIVTGAAGLIVAAIPGLIAFGITSLFTSGPLTWIIAVLVALPFFFLILGSPLLLIGGWVQIFSSSVWTLTYRELKVLEHLAPSAAPSETA